MLPRHYSSEGIVLRRRNYSEADRILIIFSKHYGKLRLLARGVRRPESRKRGHLEVFSRVKFSAIRTKELDLMEEVDLIDSYPQIRNSLKKIALSYYFMELIDRVTQEHEPNEKLYEFILHYLESLKAAKDLKALRLDFVANLLVSLGFWPSGKKLNNVDAYLEQVLERRLSSLRIGKKLLK